MRALLMKSGKKASDIDLIGYHGQTVYHQPSQSRTVQLGDGAALHKSLNIPVVCDFRTKDVQNGGQGAPLAPVFHRALAANKGLMPCAVINCGGIANVSLLFSRDEMRAFDTGPGNCLVDAFVRSRTGGREFMDEGGRYGSLGSVRSDLLEQLWGLSLHGRKQGYYDQPSDTPKSLDTADFATEAVLGALQGLSLEDGCRTLEAFTAITIHKAMIDMIGGTSYTHHIHGYINTWVLAGGGWRNPVITAELRAKAPAEVRVLHADEVGWSGQYMEAELMGYLAARVRRGLPIGFPGTTGVRDPALTGATIFE